MTPQLERQFWIALEAEIALAFWIGEKTYERGWRRNVRFQAWSWRGKGRTNQFWNRWIKDRQAVLLGYRPNAWKDALI